MDVSSGWPKPGVRLFFPVVGRPEKAVDGTVVAQCQVRGASVAGVALAHGINANNVHRWLRERAGQPPQAPSGFVALSLPTAHGKLEEESAKLAQDIRIELRRGATVVNVACPLAQASECAAWMSELLR